MLFTSSALVGEKTVKVSGKAIYIDYEPTSEWEGSGSWEKKSELFEYTFLDYSFNENWKKTLVKYLKENVLSAENIIMHVHLRDLIFGLPAKDINDSDDDDDNRSTSDD